MTPHVAVPRQTLAALLLASLPLVAPAQPAAPAAPPASAATPSRATVPMPAAASSAGPVEPVRVRAVAHFAFDRVQIDAADRPGLLAEVGRMKDVTWQSVTATGHTDAVGDADYNQRLSGRRAASVKRWLVQQGLPDDLINVAAAGEGQPVADNATANGRAANRRTEVEFRGVRPTAR